MTNKKEISSILNNSKTLFDIFNFHVDNSPNKNIFFSKNKNDWHSQSFLKTYENIEKIKYFFLKNNLKKGDRVFLLSSNRIEWVEFDLAIMSLGGVTVPSFVTNNVADNHFIIKDCEPKFIILENESVFEKNKSFLNNIKKNILLIEQSDSFINYKKILLNSKKQTKKINRYFSISSIIYTSGTTGNPKGVILSHKSIIHNLLGALDIMDEFHLKNEKFLSFLPLSHSYERMAGLYFPILVSAQVYFCSSIDKLFNEIKEVKPTIVSAVPRLYENIYKRIKAQIHTSNSLVSFFLKKVFDYTKLDKTQVNFLDVLFVKIFINLIFKKKLKNNFGGKIKIFISGGAALNPEIGSFFNKIGLPLLQGYGQTEASPLISCNKKLTNNPTTVGPPVRGVLVKISKNNEILVKGKNLMLGYWNNPSLTKKTIINGWLHTGDLGFIDELGRIIITGRKKDLIVTSGGDNISAQRIEGYLTSYNEISQAIVFGDSKPFLISLIKMNDNFTEVDLKKIINNLNQKLNSIEKIRKYIILDEELTYEKGFMTQTMKIKRKKVFEYYKNQINALY